MGAASSKFIAEGFSDWEIERFFRFFLCQNISFAIKGGAFGFAWYFLFQNQCDNNSNIGQSLPCSVFVIPTTWCGMVEGWARLHCQISKALKIYEPMSSICWPLKYWTRKTKVMNFWLSQISRFFVFALISNSSIQEIKATRANLNFSYSHYSKLTNLFFLLLTASLTIVQMRSFHTGPVV